MIVAIDGPAGSGKSTIARMIAESLGFTYVNSGNLYRAMTLRALNEGISLDAREAVTQCSRAAEIVYRDGRLHLDGRDAEDELHSARVDALVAQLSAIPEVREIVNALVRRIADDLDSVVEGRDMTTVVFPDAELKFFLDASPEARAQRRFSQGTSGASLEEIKANIEMRDAIDRGKSVGSL
ncbi:MAG TPA: (d)CMP kinase, partial [Rectinemataceae bacterium]|nr:(d)CMP kinase [Rectinemataceae bacterium]